MGIPGFPLSRDFRDPVVIVLTHKSEYGTHVSQQITSICSHNKSEYGSHVSQQITSEFRY